MDFRRKEERIKMEEVTIKNYQQLAMHTCLPSARNWEYCYCLIASEIGEAFGKWGKKFRDGEFDKDKLADELGDVFWGVALACELEGYNFEELWKIKDNNPFLEVMFPTPVRFEYWEWFHGKAFDEKEVWGFLMFAKTFAEECGIDPLDCLKRNIAKLAGRKERGTLGGNGDER